MSWPPSHIAYSVLSPHRTAVRDLNLQALDLLREFDALRIIQRLVVLIYRLDIKNLAQEINDGLRLVEGRGGHVDVEAHLPLGGPHRLVEAEPDLATAAQRIVEVELWR